MSADQTHIVVLSHGYAQLHWEWLSCFVEKTEEGGYFFSAYSFAATDLGLCDFVVADPNGGTNRVLLPAREIEAILLEANPKNRLGFVWLGLI